MFTFLSLWEETSFSQLWIYASWLSSSANKGKQLSEETSAGGDPKLNWDCQLEPRHRPSVEGNYFRLKLPSIRPSRILTPESTDISRFQPLKCQAYMKNFNAFVREAWPPPCVLGDAFPHLVRRVQSTFLSWSRLQNFLFLLVCFWSFLAFFSTSLLSAAFLERARCCQSPFEDRLRLRSSTSETSISIGISHFRERW